MSAKPAGPLESVDAIASTLKQLIRTSIDGQNGFRLAASEVGDPNLKRLFESYSQQRGEFAAELQEELKRYGHEPDESGHGAPAPHPSLMDVEAAATGRNEGVIISERGRAEDLALKAYETALSSTLPNELRTIIERQSIRVKEAHDQVRSLERTHDRHS